MYVCLSQKPYTSKLHPKFLCIGPIAWICGSIFSRAASVETNADGWRCAPHHPPFLRISSLSVYYFSVSCTCIPPANNGYVPATLNTAVLQRQRSGVQRLRLTSDDCPVNRPPMRRRNYRVSSRLRRRRQCESGITRVELACEAGVDLCRVISRASGLKLVVQTLLSSLRPIGNIVLICCTFFIIFGILGVQVGYYTSVVSVLQLIVPLKSAYPF